MPKYKPNAYGEYVSEFRKIRARVDNIIYPSFEAASLDAAPLWERLPSADREFYKSLANKKREEADKQVDTKTQDKMQAKTAKSTKKTSQGKLLSEVHLEENISKNSILKRRRYVETFINNAKKNKDLCKQVFYVMHSTTYIEDERDSYHAEIGVVSFSLERGLTSSLHLFVDHEGLPTGFVHDARDKSNREHRILLPPYDNQVLNPLDYERAYFEVRNFLTTNNDDGYYHLYTTEDQVGITENFFVRCSQDLDDPFLPQNYIVHNYADLFINLMKVAYEDQRPEVICNSLIRDIIARDTHDMLKSLSCKYHYEVDALPSCSLSRARRLAHYICEEVCNQFHIYMTKGAHYPIEGMCEQRFPMGARPGKPAAEPVPEKKEEEKTGVASGGPSQPSSLCKEAGKYPTQNDDSFTRPRTSIRRNVPNDQNRPPRFGHNSPRDQARPGTSGIRQGATASCMKLSRGGGNKTLAKDLQHPESSEDELDHVPHKDPAYANIVKPWETAFTPADVDPTLFVGRGDESREILEPLENLELNKQQPKTPSRNRFPIRKGNLAANFDNEME